MSEGISKVKSLAELKKIKEQSLANTNLRTTGENPDRTVILVGMATCGIAAGARPVMESLLNEIANLKIENVSVVATGCLGYCYAEPMVEVRVPNMEPVRYGNVNAGLASEIITKHIMNGEFLDKAIIGREVPKSE